MAYNVCSAAEHELFSGANVPLNSPIDLRDSNIDRSFCDLSASADDERSILGRHVSGEVAVDTQHRFEADFTRKIHDIADKAEPIVLTGVGATAVDEFRLAAIVSARKCLSSHWLLPFFLLSSVAR